MAIEVIESFISDCQAKGLDPADAMILFRERQNYAFKQWIAPHELKRPIVQQMVAIRERLIDALDGIQSKEDLNTYGQQWANIAMEGRTTPKGISTSENHSRALAVFQDIWWDERSYVSLSDDWQGFIQRASGAIAFSDTGEWGTIRAMEPDWDDVRHAMTKEQTLGLELAETAASATKQAQQALIATAEKVGLRALQWNALGGQEQTTVTRLADMLSRAETELETQTGYQGQVLGLKGRARLGIGVLPFGGPAYGGAENQGSQGIQITTPCDVGAGAIGHEWLHGLDAMIGHAQGCTWGCMASEATDTQRAQHPGLLPWKTMVTKLDQYGSAKKIQAIKAEALSQATKDLEARWQEYFTPSGVQRELNLAEIIQQSRTPSWDKEATFQAIEQAWSRVLGPNADSVMGADTMIAELELLHQRAHEAQSSPHSLWKTFREMLDQRFDDTGHAATEGRKGYLSEPAEMLAHAFEMRLDKTSAMGDRFVGQTSLRYPMKEEVAAQDRHWKTFFKARPLLRIGKRFPCWRRPFAWRPR